MTRKRTRKRRRQPKVVATPTKREKVRSED
jgi:hypothetical protein